MEGTFLGAFSFAEKLFKNFHILTLISIYIC